MALPAKLQNDIRQYQRLQQDLSQVSQQRMQIDLKLRETTHTLEELKTVPDDAVIYRPIGALLVKAQSKKEVVDLLTDDKETLEVRVKALERNENQLKERYTTMTKELSVALQAAGVTPPTGTP
jgi:prefoldin beta subunit